VPRTKLSSTKKAPAGAVLVPSDIPPGQYDLQIGILDPLSNKPKVQLAISGKQPDGWYYLGKIKIRK